jgi:hypothetical protein
MANAQRDENNVPTLIGVLESDGQTITRVTVGTGHSLGVENDTTGSDNGPGPRALRDENFVTTLIGVSDVDGVTPVVVYTDSDGKLLIDSN